MNGKRLRALLFFSLMLNVAFVSLAAVRMREAPKSSTNERPRRGPLVEKWHHKRAAALSRALDLEPAQRAALRTQLEPLRAQLYETRLELGEVRRQFHSALARRDVSAVRTQQQSVSSIQARFDSLTAEAMLRELDVLSESQRERYLRRTFRSERARRLRKHRPGGPGMMQFHRRHSDSGSIFNQPHHEFSGEFSGTGSFDAVAPPVPKHRMQKGSS